jgi:uncharacterized repeat protein (TIGR03803 family)
LSGLTLSGNTLYGTAEWGGISGNGTIYKINTDGTGFANLHVFTEGSNTNSDGANPEGGLVLSGNTLYGTARELGAFGPGTVFAINTDGTGFTNLHNFNITDGQEPEGDLILSGNTLYGTTYRGGSFTRGTVFKLNTDGTSFTNLHNFDVEDGYYPEAGLFLSGNTLYGTTFEGGNSQVVAVGTVFAIRTDGTGFTNLYNFPAPGSNGYHLHGSVTLSGNTLFGTASIAHGYQGTVFSLSLPSPTHLNIASVGTQSILFLPISTTNYILQSTADLSAPNWVTASDAVPVIAFTVTNTSTPRFFRIIGQ